MKFKWVPLILLVALVRSPLIHGDHLQGPEVNKGGRALSGDIVRPWKNISDSDLQKGADQQVKDWREMEERQQTCLYEVDEPITICDRLSGTRTS